MTWRSSAVSFIRIVEEQSKEQYKLILGVLRNLFGRVPMTNLYKIIPGVRFVQSKLNQIWSYIPPPPRLSISSNANDKAANKILVVHSHPNPESYSAAIAQTFIEASTNASHEIRRISLYEHSSDPTKCYRPNLSRSERDNYFNLIDHSSTANTNSFQLAPEVKDHIESLQWCDTLVFIYPTWWMNTPASVKGFIDRTLVPGPTWELPSSSRTGVASLGLVPKLNNIQRIIGISTYGANNMTVFLAGDNGRRMISNAIRHSVCPNASVAWLGLYGVDTATLQQRQDFLKNVANLPFSTYF